MTPEMKKEIEKFIIDKFSVTMEESSRHTKMEEELVWEFQNVVIGAVNKAMYLRGEGEKISNSN